MTDRNKLRDDAARDLWEKHGERSDEPLNRLYALERNRLMADQTQTQPDQAQAEQLAQQCDQLAQQQQQPAQEGQPQAYGASFVEHYQALAAALRARDANAALRAVRDVFNHLLGEEGGTPTVGAAGDAVSLNPAFLLIVAQILQFFANRR